MNCINCGSKLRKEVKICSNCGEKIENKNGPSKTEESGKKEEGKEFSYAGFWKRVGAYIIDFLVILILVALIGFIHGFLISTLSPTTPEEPAGFSVLIIVTLITWIYYAGMESSSKQATLGKQALGIIVTDLDGNRVSFARATGRHFAKFISSLLFLIGYIMVAFTEKKQGLHDIIADCLVVDK